jgi:protocatechuate 3,4-dioxygenase beta subunit
MNRKKFLTEGLTGFGAIIALPSAITACKKKTTGTTTGCEVMPAETKGPFPNLTPAQLVRRNIVSDRTGVALLMTLTIKDSSENCNVLQDVLVDVWHCDKEGNYSQYGTSSAANFLRGRQTTDANGQVSFLSIFPGWYPGRAPHIHVEVLSAGGSSLLVSQIAFPPSVYNTVYATSGYRGTADTSNTQDGIFRDSIDKNLSDSVTGNITDGYILLKTIIVP